MKYWKSIIKPVSKGLDNDLELPHLAGNNAKGYTEGAGDSLSSKICTPVDYKGTVERWYFGHYHIDKQIEDKYIYLFDKVVAIG